MATDVAGNAWQPRVFFKGGLLLLRRVPVLLVSHSTVMKTNKQKTIALHKAFGKYEINIIDVINICQTS